MTTWHWIFVGDEVCQEAFDLARSYYGPYDNIFVCGTVAPRGRPLSVEMLDTSSGVLYWLEHESQVGGMGIVPVEVDASEVERLVLSVPGTRVAFLPAESAMLKVPYINLFDCVVVQTNYVIYGDELDFLGSLLIRGLVATMSTVSLSGLHMRQYCRMMEKLMNRIAPTPPTDKP